MATVKELKNAGRLEEALEMAKNLYEAEKDNVYSKNSLAWVYDALCKRAAEAGDLNGFNKYLSEIKLLGVLSEEMMSKTMCWRLLLLTKNLKNDDKRNVDTFNLLFDVARELNLAKPSTEYTILLKAFLNLKECDEFKMFCDWWNFDNFMPEDYEEELIPDGRKVMSVVEQAYIAYSKLLLRLKSMSEIRNFQPRLHDIAERYPKMTYMGYYCAKLLLTEGDVENALDALLPFAQKKKSEFWVWQLLGETQKSKSLKTALACYIRATKCRADEKFLVRVRQELMGILAAMKRYDEARFQIEQILKCTQTNGIKIPSQVANWANKEWISTAKSKAEIDGIDYMAITDNLLYGNIPCSMAVVSFVNKDKGIANVIYGRKKIGFFKYSRWFGKINVGDLLDLRISRVGDNGRLEVVTAAIHDGELLDADYYTQVTGSVRTNDAKTFYYVACNGEQVYIPMSCVKDNNLSVGQSVKVRALYEYNRKREKWGWRCVSVIQL